MDITLLRNLLQHRRGLASVQLQNHIYGCYLIMEDIATKTLQYHNGTLTGTNFKIDLSSEFQDIGLRYGFVMDTKLALTDIPAEYRANWMSWFLHLSTHADALKEVDAMEDQINIVIREAVHPDDAFFMKAVETGSLPQEWTGKLIRWLQHGDKEVTEPKVAMPEPKVHLSEPAVSEEEPATTKLSQAKTEKTFDKPKRRILASTIRHRPIRTHTRITSTTRRSKVIKL